MFYELLPQRRFPVARAVIIALLLVEYLWFVRPKSEFFDYFAFDTPRIGTAVEPKIVGSELLVTGETMSHAATAAILPDGDLLALWYSGSAEGKSDVKIFSCRRHNGVWETPSLFLSREELARQSRRYVKKLGNAVLYSQEGRLFCWVVSVGFGGWSGSSMNLLISDDGGKSYARARRLRLSPLLNLSNLARPAALPMGHSRMGVPFYHELIKKYGLFAIVDHSGRVLRRTRIAADDEALQPVVIPLSGQEGLALLRNGGGAPKSAILTATTYDAGRHFLTGNPLPIENHDSGLAAIRLGERLFLAANPGLDRSKLVLYEATLKEPRQWKEVLTVEDEPGCEFSYPTLLASDDGTLDLLYTWKRQGIKAVRIACWEESR